MVLLTRAWHYVYYFSGQLACCFLALHYLLFCSYVTISDAEQVACKCLRQFFVSAASERSIYSLLHQCYCSDLLYDILTSQPAWDLCVCGYVGTAVLLSSGIRVAILVAFHLESYVGVCLSAVHWPLRAGMCWYHRVLSIVLVKKLRLKPWRANGRFFMGACKLARHLVAAIRNTRLLRHRPCVCFSQVFQHSMQRRRRCKHLLVSADSHDFDSRGL